MTCRVVRTPKGNIARVRGAGSPSPESEKAIAALIDAAAAHLGQRQETGMQPETGESTASIKRRWDDEEWPRVFEGLKGGATLFRPPGLENYFIDRGNGAIGGGRLTPTRVRKLEAEGVIRHVGVDRYALAPAKGD